MTQRVLVLPSDRANVEVRANRLSGGRSHVPCLEPSGLPRCPTLLIDCHRKSNVTLTTSAQRKILSSN